MRMNSEHASSSFNRTSSYWCCRKMSPSLCKHWTAPSRLPLRTNSEHTSIFNRASSYWSCIAKPLQALDSPKLIVNEDEFGTHHLHLQPGLLGLALYSQNAAETLQALGSPGLIADEDEFR